MSTLQLESDQSKIMTYQAHRHIRPVGVRVNKAARAGMPFFIAAIIGVFVPILHFVIVPAALIAMIFLATREMTTHFSFTVEKMECPHCQASYGETEFERLPKRMMCFNCRVASTLTEIGSYTATSSQGS